MGPCNFCVTQGPELCLTLLSSHSQAGQLIQSRHILAKWTSEDFLCQHAAVSDPPAQDELPDIHLTETFTLIAEPLPAPP